MVNLHFDIYDLIIITAVISAGLYFTKATEKKDLTYVAIGLSRIYFATILILADYFPDLGVKLKDVGVAILVLLAADLMGSSIYLFGKKYIKEIQYKLYSEKLKEMQDKFALIVENSPVGFFTLSMNGDFEFANSKLLEILETDNLDKKNIFDFLEKDVTSSILVREKFSFPSVNMITKKGRIIKVQLIGGFTRNGHETITGTVHPLD